MDLKFKAILNQIERPYWSPVHPSRYVKTIHRGKSKDGRYLAIRQGWGLSYPDDIGYFNLVWLLAGIGMPPDDYARFSDLVVQAFELGRYAAGNTHELDARGQPHPRTLKDLAARTPLERFYLDVRRAGNPAFEPLLRAARLRV